jgi:hypothetical protein
MLDTALHTSAARAEVDISFLNGQFVFIDEYAILARAVGLICAFSTACMCRVSTTDHW